MHMHKLNSHEIKLVSIFIKLHSTQREPINILCNRLRFDYFEMF